MDVELDIESVDYRKINPYNNKMLVFGFKNDIRSTAHSILDEEIIKGVKPKKATKELCSQISKIPVLKKRLPIFLELQKLASSKRWYGFYALALPQVEGIVFELLKLVGVNAEGLKALPQKIAELANVSPNKDFDMDYYQFILPDKRNKFAHSGKDEKMKLKSLHLMLDLRHLLAVAENLEDDFFRLNNMVNDGVLGINHIGDLANLLKLSKSNKSHAEYADIKPKLDELIYKKLISRYDFPKLINELSKVTTQQVEEYDSQLMGQFYIMGETPIDFRQITTGDLVQKYPLVSRAIENGIFSEPYRLLLDIYFFIENFNSLFPNLPKAILDALITFKQDHQDVWDKLRFLYAKDVSHTPGDYLMVRKDMMALMNNADREYKKIWNRSIRYFKKLYKQFFGNLEK